MSDPNRRYVDEDDDQTYLWIRDSLIALAVVFCLGVTAICLYPWL